MTSKKYFLIALLCAGLASVEATADTDNLLYINACLSNWKVHPFDARNPKFRVLATKVKIMGIGGDINDSVATSAPDLVLIKPNVSVMTKARLSLMNPNGWYCLQSKVSVMSKTIIDLHCNAQLASTADGATVLGANENDDGVTVMGKAVINRLGCSE